MGQEAQEQWPMLEHTVELADRGNETQRHNQTHQNFQDSALRKPDVKVLPRTFYSEN